MNLSLASLTTEPHEEGQVAGSKEHCEECPCEERLLPRTCLAKKDDGWVRSLRKRTHRFARRGYAPGLTVDQAAIAEQLSWQLRQHSTQASMSPTCWQLFAHASQISAQARQ
ncbi:hypothetical protein LOC71_13125 [Rhodopirellula sp. JC740]|uniref:Uncharacterized protein n=1 Tax=Rhodopirellula halodulae TaxID=2894198 RepID=A0ABS8NI28_9BACT|nr:hypothetical protein [Rhodopirellula sp. JC740]MCC9643220.1 hypothetical protein [Rhodopirellula sp. JC740]